MDDIPCRLTVMLGVPSDLSVDHTFLFRDITLPFALMPGLKLQHVHPEVVRVAHPDLWEVEVGSVAYDLDPGPDEPPLCFGCPPIKAVDAAQHAEFRKAYIEAGWTALEG